MKRYYVLEEEYESGPIKGDVFVWEGEYWNEADPDKGASLLVRYLYDYDGFYFIVPRDHLVEFVAERDIEDPDKYHNAPTGFRKIWNILMDRMK